MQRYCRMERVSTSETSELYLVQDGEEVRLDSLEATARTNISECASVHKGICDLKANGSSFSFNFVGIFLAKSTPFFVFPKCFSFSTDKKSGNLADSARLLYKVLSRYKQDGKYRREAELYLAGSSSTLSNQIDAALHILKDYKENGLLNPKARYEKQNGKARVNWPRTITKCYPLFSNGSPVYTSVISGEWQTQHDNLLVKIHAAVLTKASDIWGWLANVEVNRNDRSATLPISPRGAILYLTRMLQRVYHQREINIINFLIQFLKSSSDARKSDISLFGTQNYEHLWESICGYVFDNSYESLKHNIPQPKWTMQMCVRAGEKCKQIPDILSVHGAALYILDAKYYNYDKTLPGWPDIVKQFFYMRTIVADNRAQSIIKTLSLKEVFNIFILPNSDRQCSDDITRIGSVSVQGNDELGSIDVLGINQNKAMWLYANRARYREKDKFKADFISFVQKHCRQTKVVNATL